MKEKGNHIGVRIVALRQKRDLTQKDLAVAIGVTPPSIFELESGQTRNPRAITLLKIALTLGVDPVYLLTGHRGVSGAKALMQLSGRG